MSFSRCLFAAVLIGIVTTVYPVRSDHLWLNIAQGRSVCSSILNGKLIDIHHRVESNWLGTVPVSVAYSMGSGSGLMALKLSLAIGCGFALLRLLPKPHCGAFFLVLLTLMCLRDAWDVSALAFEIPCVLMIGHILNRWSVSPNWKSVSALAFIYILWANTGDRVLLGLCLLTCHIIPLLRDHSTRRSALGMFCITAAAICLNPRGSMIYYDSFCLTWPKFFEAALTLDAAGKNSFSSIVFDSTGIAFTIIVLIAAVHFCLSRTAAGDICYFMLAMVSAFLTTTNLPVAAVWMTSTLLSSSGVSNLLSKASVSRDAAIARGHSLIQPGSFLHRLMPICRSACILFAIVSGSGCWPGSAQRFGWGIHPQLEIRLCERAIEGIKIDGPVWCSSVRAAGMMAWLRPDKSTVPTDFVRQALLNGKLQEWFLLRQDLANGRQAWHQRDDGSSGGWWIPIMGSSTCLLMIDTLDLDLIRSLEPTLWKPLSVDSPVIPFAIAGNVSANDRIVTVLGERDFLESGPWTYTPPSPAGDDLHWDLAGQLTGRVDRSLVLQQAQVLHAMNLPAASLRILNPVLGQSVRGDFLLMEFARCQFQLAHNEQLLMGKPSLWRRIVCRNIDQPAEVVSPDWLADPTATRVAMARELQKAASLYIEGQLHAAIEILGNEGPECQYARALLLLESGRPVECREVLLHNIATYPENPLTVASHDVLSLLPQ